LLTGYFIHQRRLALAVANHINLQAATTLYTSVLCEFQHEQQTEIYETFGITTLPCTSPPDVIYANMISAGSGRGVTSEPNGWANFGPLRPIWPVNAGQYGQAGRSPKKNSATIRHSSLTC